MVMRRNTFENGNSNLSLKDVLEQVDQRIVSVSGAVTENILNETGLLGQGGQVTPMSGQAGIPPTLSQEYLQFVDGTDEIPEWFRKKYWGILTRMNQFTQIRNEFEQEKMEASMRAMLRPFQWHNKIPSEDYFMIQHFGKIQMLKAFKGIERRLVAPQLSEITRREEYSDNTVINKNVQTPGGVRGAISGVFGR